MTPPATAEIPPLPQAATAPNILFLQTAEVTYKPLLELTSQTVREYCSRHRHSYECFFGIVRGYHPWHAAYNRIPLLKRLLNAGYPGWVCYLDADAFITDLDFDLRAYLQDKQNLALIAAAAGPNLPWWEVNDGVFLINLAHPVGRAIVGEWSRRFDEITDEQLEKAKAWSQVPDDQRLLQDILKETVGAERNTLVLWKQPRPLNYADGSFIRQVLRAAGGLESRAAYLKWEVEKALGVSAQPASDSHGSAEGKLHEALAGALYRVLFLRPPDPGGLARAVTKLQAGVSFEDVMRSCLISSEFAENHRRFIETYVRRDRLNARTQETQSPRTISCTIREEGAAMSMSVPNSHPDAEIFARHYESKESTWGRSSGPGSHPYHMIEYRAFLEKFIGMNKIRSVVDLGCGDWKFSKYINWEGVQYTGLDVVQSVVDANSARFGAENIKFLPAPVDFAEIPSADLLIIKDVLQHLPNDEIIRIKDELFGRFQHILLTNSFQKPNSPRNIDIPTGGFRCLDLAAPPFSFPGSYVLEFSSAVWERIRTFIYRA